MFEDDLEFLRRRCALVGLEGLEEILNGGLPSGVPAAMVTVDDGLAEGHSQMRPILLRTSVPATYFITTDFVDNRKMFYRHKASLLVDRILTADRGAQAEWLLSAKTETGVSFSGLASLCGFILSIRSDRSGQIDRLCELIELDVGEYLRAQRPYLTTDQIRELAEDGFSIGAHGLDHSDFGALTSDEIERRMVGACEFIAETTGYAPVSFAFPFNMQGLDRRMILEIATANSVVGTLFGAGGMVQSPPFVNRIFADSPDRIFMGGSNLPRRLKELYKGFWRSGNPSF